MQLYRYISSSDIVHGDANSISNLSQRSDDCKMQRTSRQVILDARPSFHCCITSYVQLDVVFILTDEERKIETARDRLVTSASVVVAGKSSSVRTSDDGRRGARPPGNMLSLRRRPTAVATSIAYIRLRGKAETRN